MIEYSIDYIKKNNLILLEVISGSHAYGLNTETSDFDERGIFVQPVDDFLGLKNVEQINDEKNDITYYELKRFCNLALQNNPNILELLNVPEDCILYKHPLFDLLKPEYFLSKKCRITFGGYAIAQIKKARGLNKKIVNPISKEKKTPLDFCYVIENEKSYPLIIFLDKNKMEQKFCGLVNIPNAKDIYSLFYDWSSHYCFSNQESEENRERTKQHLKSRGQSLGLGYKGIIKEDEEGEFHSDDIRLSSISKEQISQCIFSYNKDGYTQYCKQYKEYWEWVEKRNPQRYLENISSDKGFDGKNIMHCFRLLEMAKEIAEGKGIILKRPDREFLLNIRNGKMEYKDLIDRAEKSIEGLDLLYEKSNLPTKPNVNKINELLIKIRREFK